MGIVISLWGAILPWPYPLVALLMILMPVVLLSAIYRSQGMIKLDGQRYSNKKYL